MMKIHRTGVAMVVAGALMVACGSDSTADGGAGAGASGGSGGAAGASGAAGGSGGDAGSGGSGAGAGGVSGTGGASAGSGGAAGTGGAAGAAGNAGGGGGYLSDKYPGDVGIDKDPAVVWTENFEEGSVSALTARYNDSKKKGMDFDTDVPANSTGHASGKWTANGAGPHAVDLYKRLDKGFDELYVRYYAKYGSGAKWHHTGVWVGGYNPPSKWPNPQAGLKPNGDDRFSVSFEPMGASPNPRMDFYNYWMKMHSWMDNPSGNTAYYGNSLVHQASVKATDNKWMCVELHIKLNTSLDSSQGAELGLWVNDKSIVQFTDAAPQGCWIKDKFCSQTAPVADDPGCTKYPNLCKKPYVPLDLQMRSTAALNLNAFWPQNYITEGGAGTVWYDDMVVARERIGCLR